AVHGLQRDHSFILRPTLSSSNGREAMSEKFSAEERAAMRARAKELKETEDGEKAIKAAFAKMAPADRALGKKIDELVRNAAPGTRAGGPRSSCGVPTHPFALSSSRRRRLASAPRGGTAAGYSARSSAPGRAGSPAAAWRVRQRWSAPSARRSTKSAGGPPR